MKCSAPINIKHYPEILNCDGKCNFEYNYKVTGISCINKRKYLEINLENKFDKVATFSTNTRSINCLSQGGEYRVEKVYIFKKSVHKFNGIKTDGELIIEHKNMGGGSSLLLCIPISKTTGNLFNASNTLKEIISQMANIGNRYGQGGTIYNLNFNLNNFISNKGYYTYSASNLINTSSNNCNDKCTNYIVYDLNTTCINISSSIYDKLDNIITSYYYEIQPFSRDLGLAYNSSGAKKLDGSNTSDIYIDCQPTGDDGQLLVNESKSENTLENIEVKNSNYEEYIKKFIHSIRKYLFITVGIILVIILFMFVKKILKNIFIENN